MKNIYNFYALIFLPFIAILLLGKYDIIGNYAFGCLLMFYCLIYHPLISGLRLIASHRIAKNQLWYNFIPGWNWKYFSFLFFNAVG